MLLRCGIEEIGIGFRHYARRMDSKNKLSFFFYGFNRMYLFNKRFQVIFSLIILYLWHLKHFQPGYDMKTKLLLSSIFQMDFEVF